jgi:beta-galactosidase/beta-glucuronidase
MKNITLQLFVLLLTFSLNTKAQDWKPAGDKIKTDWAKDVSPNFNPPQYPRPILERGAWLNLDGLWDYAIVSKGSAMPDRYDGKILVPYPIESSLSGVQKTVGETNELWYNRNFEVPKNWHSKKVLLHFGAVDWKTDIWINNIKIATHKGGYTPIDLDITPYLIKNQLQNLKVKVWDPTDKGFQPHGKQVSKPGGIMYTANTGIWQTVWIEPVNENYITNFKTVPNIDQNTVSVLPVLKEYVSTDIIEVAVLDKNKKQVFTKASAAAGQEVVLSVPNPKLWSPETPFLYDLKVTLKRNGVIIDSVWSYFGMRKISTKRDDNGIVRLQLNNKDYFQFGPLDQGWWPDGLYTAPNDAALYFDIKKIKDFGFNMIRKHVKVEPARWYYLCDLEGILVWQDMPSGDRSPQWQTRNFFNGTEVTRSSESETEYRTEWKDIIDLLYSNPCIVTWVTFNESWGQFKTPEIAEWTKTYDPSRLVNPASGGNYYPVGDMLDVHNYPDPQMNLYDGNRACVLGEYGGIGLAVENHLWETGKNWGYVQFKTSEEATNEYIRLAEKLKKLIPMGFSAAVYTQITDVESEVNGLMTYDRKVIKLNEERIRKINKEICNSLNAK